MTHRRVSMTNTALRVLLLVVGILTSLPSSAESQLSNQDKDRARKMLEQMRKDLHEFYYDSTFGGIDIDASALKADSAIQAAPNMNHALGIIAQYLADLKDSHTSFSPPSHVARVDYGVSLLTVGDAVFVSSVRKGSDAEAKGLKRGDQVLAFDQFKTTRQSLRIIQYVYFRLSPRPAINMTVISPGEQQPRKVMIEAKITEGQRVVDYTDISQLSRIYSEMDDASRAATNFYRSIGDSIMIWRMPMFAYADNAAIDEMIERAQTYRAVILDLRNNPGGYIATLQYLTGRFFNRDIEMYTARERKKSTMMVATAAKNPYLGFLVVLINSNSASSAEMLSRTLQLQGRAIVVGDRSAGAVITSVSVPHIVGFDRVLSYGASMSVADVVMVDGQRLENEGVIPDHLVLPTGADLAAGRDVQMQKALEVVGMVVSADEATKLARGAPPLPKPE